MTATVPTLTIRRARPDDAATLHTLVRELAAEDGDPSDVRSTAGDWAGMLARPEVLVLLAERDGEPVGYVSAVRGLHLWNGADIVALDDLYVREGHRDAGVGRRLMARMAGLADGQVIRWEAHQDNTAAHRFYRRLGAVQRTKAIFSWQPAAAQA